VAAGNGAEGESKPRVVLSQQLGSTRVESGKRSGDADASTSLVDGGIFGELTGHEKEEGQVEKEEEDDKRDIDPQGRQAGRCAIRCDSMNRLGGSDTHRKRKVIMNQAAKKIPIALVSSPL